ncbi:MAG: response regulator transcription factor [Verrucomicrobiota bacterium]
MPSQKKPPNRRPVKARIFLVDDHPALRTGVANCIFNQPDMTVCGQAGNATEAMEGIEKENPDLALVDISMSGRDGFALIRDIKARGLGVRILVFSMHNASLYTERVLRAGASGYVTKSAPTEELIQAIRRVLAGEIVVDSEVIERILERTSTGAQTGLSSPLEQLTNRELEIYRLLGGGCSRLEIAAQLHLSVKTIESHRANLRQKLGLKNSKELMRHASEYLRDELAEA